MSSISRLADSAGERKRSGDWGCPLEIALDTLVCFKESYETARTRALKMMMLMQTNVSIYLTLKYNTADIESKVRLYALFSFIQLIFTEFLISYHTTSAPVFMQGTACWVLWYRVSFHKSLFFTSLTSQRQTKSSINHRLRVSLAWRLDSCVNTFREESDRSFLEIITKHWRGPLKSHFTAATSRATLTTCSLMLWSTSINHSTVTSFQPTFSIPSSSSTLSCI